MANELRVATGDPTGLVRGARAPDVGVHNCTVQTSPLWALCLWPLPGCAVAVPVSLCLWLSSALWALGAEKSEECRCRHRVAQ